MQIDPFQGRLLPGERIMWSGRPGQGILFSPQDWFLIPFSLMWGGFAVFWEATAVTQARTPFFFRLFGLPFVVAGLFLIVGRFWVDALLRANMYYAVTDQRVLIVRERWFATFISLDLAQLPALEVVDAGRGRSTIYFAPAPPPMTSYGRGRAIGWLPALEARPKFMAVDGAQILVSQILARRRGLGELVPGAVGSVQMPARGFLWPAMRPLQILVAALVPVGLILWNTVLCFGVGGAGLYAARSFATTEASFKQGARVPATRFGVADTVMSIVVVSWPDGTSGGTHRVVWNWYREGALVFHIRRCHMHFDERPFSVWSWHTASGIGGGHYRVDTLVDGRVVGQTQFDVDAPLVQGAL